jgi:hypothetical protein
MAVVAFFKHRVGKHKGCPTQRAPDAGESARFSGIFATLAFFSLDGVPPSAPAQVTHTVGRFETKPIQQFCGSLEKLPGAHASA